MIDTGPAAAQPAGEPGGGAPARDALLAFDTSTESMAIALWAGDTCWCWNGAGGAAASAQLLPQIRALMQRAGVGWEQLQGIAFGRGPGAFTGLRTACAVAQGLALGAALPVLPVDSLLLVAEGVRAEHPGTPADIDVVMDARMGEVYAGRYRWHGTHWKPVVAPALHSLDSLHAAWALQPPHCVAGSAVQAFGTALSSGAAQRVTEDIDRAAALMRVARQGWRDEGGVDAAAALPLYLRDKVALTADERAAAQRLAQ